MMTKITNLLVWSKAKRSYLTIDSHIILETSGTAKSHR